LELELVSTRDEEASDLIEVLKNVFLQGLYLAGTSSTLYAL
jgi:hypothetical protein